MLSLTKVCLYASLLQTAFAATAAEWRSRSIYQCVPLLPCCPTIYLLAVTELLRTATLFPQVPTPPSVILANRPSAAVHGTPSVKIWTISKPLGSQLVSYMHFLSLSSFTVLLLVWISPVSANYDGPRSAYGDAYHGYWISDATQLNSRFGTADDLKALSDEVHKRGMCVFSSSNPRKLLNACI